MRHHLAHDIQERVKNLYPGDDSETIVARTILGASIYYSTCDDPINVGSFSRGVGIINIKTPEMREGDYDQIWDAQYPDAILATLHRFGMGGEAARLASPAQILSKALPQDFGIK